MPIVAAGRKGGLADSVLELLVPGRWPPLEEEELPPSVHPSNENLTDSAEAWHLGQPVLLGVSLTGTPIIEVLRPRDSSS